MKINLQIKEYSEGLKPFIDFICRFPKQRRSAPISAFVDTGSPFSCISMKDIRRMTIPIKSIIKKEDYRILYIGGRTVKGYAIHTKVEFLFVDENGQKHNLTPKTLYLLMPTKEDEKSMRLFLHLPNILGVDFLLDYKLGLYFNPSKNIAWLDMEENKG